MKETDTQGLMEISFATFSNKEKEFSEKEAIYSWKLSKLASEDEDVKGFIQFYYHPAYKKPIGTLLLDVLSTDFTSQDSFSAFVDKWGLAGLADYTDIPQTEHSDEEYMSLMKRIWHDSREDLGSAQEKLNKLIYYCLDLDGPPWMIELNNIQRFYLVQNLYEYEDTLSEMEAYLNGSISKFYIRPVNPDFDQWGFVNKRHLPEEEFARMIKDNEFEVEETISSGNLAAICYAEFKKLLLGNYSLRKCKNCNNYFILTGRIDAEYCSRVVKRYKDGTEKTCRDIGPMTRYVKKITKDPIASEYRRVYKTMHARTTAKGSSHIEDNEWEVWKKEASDKFKQAQRKEISLEEFKNWLKKSKEVSKNGKR